MLLRNRPFLGLTSFLAIGVLIGYFWFIPPAFAGCSILLVLIAILFSHRMKILRPFFGLFVVLMMMAFGVILMQTTSGKWHKNPLYTFYKPGQVYLVEIEEVGDLEKEWVKCTAKMVKLFHDTTHQLSEEKLVIFFQHPSQELSEGDQFKITSSLEWIKNKGNPGEFDVAHYWNSKGFRLMTFAGERDYTFVRTMPLSFWKRWLNGLHTYFKNAIMKQLDGQEEAVALALVLGDKSLLSRETSTSFMNTGALHVLAVSGLHVGLIMQILLTIMGQFCRWISRYQALIIVVLLMWIYAILTGMSPSVLRAVFMFSVLTIGELLGKPRDNLNTLFFTAFVLVLIDPFTLFDIGFQLSFAAMLGIFLFNPAVRMLFEPRNKLLKWFWEATAIGFAAQLMTTPLSLFYFHQFPNYFLLANTGLMLTSGLILGFGIALFAFSHVPILGWAIGKILQLLIAASLYFLQWVESLPGALATGFNPSIWWVLSASFVTVILFRYYSSTIVRRVGYITVIGLLGFLLRSRYKQLMAEHVIILNHNQPVVLWKNRDRIACFYDAKFDKLEKIKRLVQSYAVSFPGLVFYYPIHQKKYKRITKQFSLEISNNSDAVEVNLGNRNYVILKSIQQKPLKNRTTIAMPWLDVIANHQLKNGAFIIPLN